MQPSTYHAEGVPQPDAAGEPAALKLLRLLVHQVSQPLTSLLGEVELALRFGDGEAELKATLERCMRGLEQMSGLVSDLRVLGEMSEPTISNASMLNLATSAVDATGLGGTSINWRSRQDVCIRTDPRLMRRALSMALDTALSLRAPSTGVDVSLEKCRNAAVMTISFFLTDEVRAPTVGSGRDVSTGFVRSTPGADRMLIDAMIRALGGRFEVHRGRAPASQTHLCVIIPLSRDAPSRGIRDGTLNAKAWSAAGKLWQPAGRHRVRAS